MRQVNEQLALVNPLEAYKVWGSYYGQIGEFDEAVANIEKALVINPVDSDALNLFIYTLNQSRQYKDALQYAKRRFETTQDPLSYLQLAWIYGLMGDLINGLQTLQSGLHKFPDDARILESIGSVYGFREEYGKAEAHFRDMTKASQTESIRRAGFEGLASFYAYVGKYSKMMNMYDQLITFAANDNDTNSLVNRMAEKATDLFLARRDKFALQEEIQTIERLANIENDDHLGWLTNLHIAVGNIDKANDLAKSVQKQSQLWRMWNEADMAFATGRWQEAILKYEEIIRLSPDENATTANYRAAQAYYETEDFDLAILRVKESQTYYSWGHPFTYPLGFHLLGKIYEKKGHTELAIKNYEKFLDLWKDADEDLPDLHDAKARLTILKQGTT
jgi:tetratricopeptide (TPR) repeat protein